MLLTLAWEAALCIMYISEIFNFRLLKDPSSDFLIDSLNSDAFYCSPFMTTEDPLISVPLAIGLNLSTFCICLFFLLMRSLFKKVHSLNHNSFLIKPFLLWKFDALRYSSNRLFWKGRISNNEIRNDHFRINRTEIFRVLSSSIPVLVGPQDLNQI